MIVYTKNGQNGQFSLMTYLFLIFFFNIHCVNGYYDNKTVTYKGHAVIHAIPIINRHLDLLNDLLESSNEIEFWRKPGKLHSDVNLRVPGEMVEDILKRFRRSGLEHEVTVEDLQRKIDEEIELVDNDRKLGFNVSTYNTFPEISDWLYKVADQCGSVCTLISIGKSFEGRDLLLLKVGMPGPNKPIIWIDAGIHAREWIAPATAINIIQQLLGNYEDDLQVRYLLNHYIWYILPVANPDGYSYTWTHDRMWRKTRSIIPGSSCRGADPNRNWDFHWGGPGTSRDPCSENFIGTIPFSEPETKAMARMIWAVRHRLAIYLTLHSFGQYWLTPWGFTYDVPDDYEEMMTAGRRATDAMGVSGGTKYKVGTASRMLYLASGGSDDWVKGVAGVRYAYTVELRDTGRHGFILPSALIDSTSREMVNAVQALALDIARKRRFV